MVLLFPEMYKTTKYVKKTSTYYCERGIYYFNNDDLGIIMLD